MNKNILLLFLAIFLSLNLFSQKGTIRGFVSDQETGEPILFCNVSIEGTGYGSQTDLNGMYTLSKIPIGEHKIIVTYVGYEKFSKNIILKSLYLF